MTKRALISRAELTAALSMTTVDAAQHFGVTIKYLQQRARQLNLKLARVDEQPPQILKRRCSCGRIFDCRDFRRDLECPACNGAVAA